MSLHEKVLSDFIDAWNAGRRPRVLEFLAQVPDAERDALADDIETFLATAPAPELPAAARDEVRASPVVQRALAAVGEDRALWPEALPALRARAGLSLGEVASRLVGRLGLGAVDDADARTTAYLAEMEQGARRADHVSRRLLDALADVLGTSAGALADLGGGRGAFRPAPAGGTLFRRDDADTFVEVDFEALAAAASAPAPAPMDELDRLFCGGPDA
jgi:transcriptional regulator with XRE-family HTH domain